MNSRAQRNIIETAQDHHREVVLLPLTEEDHLHEETCRTLLIRDDHRDVIPRDVRYRQREAQLRHLIVRIALLRRATLLLLRVVKRKRARKVNDDVYIWQQKCIIMF